MLNEVYVWLRPRVNLLSEFVRSCYTKNLDLGFKFVAVSMFVRVEFFVGSVPP